jgi:hypothetical protein
MLQFKLIELGDKLQYQKYAKCQGHHNIEASFANKYIWLETYKTRMAMDEGAMYQLLCDEKRHFMLPPFMLDCHADIRPMMEKCEEFMCSECGGFTMKGVTAEIRDKIESDCPGIYEFIPDRDNFDYMYLSEELAALQGKKFHAKRNHINNLLKAHTFEYRAYTDADYYECIALHRKWMEHKGDNPEDNEELVVIERALKNLEVLELMCGLLFIDGKLEAFSIGEIAGCDMAIIHLEKANPDIQGAYALINREFVRHEFMGVKYINREEDMGIEGLRRAKLSYNPVFLLEKFDCVRKQ